MLICCKRTYLDREEKSLPGQRWVVCAWTDRRGVYLGREEKSSPGQRRRVYLGREEKNLHEVRSKNLHGQRGEESIDKDEKNQHGQRGESVFALYHCNTLILWRGLCVSLWILLCQQHFCCRFQGLYLEAFWSSLRIYQFIWLWPYTGMNKMKCLNVSHRSSSCFSATFYVKFCVCTVVFCHVVWITFAS